MLPDEREGFADAMERLSREIRDIAAQRTAPPPSTPPERQPWQLRISDLVALISLGGMIYAFVTNQGASQQAVVMRLDSAEKAIVESRNATATSINDVKQSADKIPLMQYQMTKMGEKQEAAEKDRVADRAKMQDIQDTLTKMGLNLTKARP